MTAGQVGAVCLFLGLIAAIVVYLSPTGVGDAGEPIA
jgi:hypothetical protein